MQAPVAPQPHTEPRAARVARGREIRTLRAEARLISMAGFILMGVGLPLTLILAALALTPDGLSPLAPLLSGAPLVAAGYAAFRYASWRLEQAAKLEEEAAPAPQSSAKS